MLKSILQPMLQPIMTGVLGDSEGEEPSVPFNHNANTYWWDFRNSQSNNVIDTLGDDTMAYAYEAIAGTVYKSLQQENKSKQPLITTNGINFNKTTQRKLELINNTGICNATNGWYCAFNMNPLTVSITIMRISGASTSTSPARGWIELAGTSTNPQIRVRIGNNDSGTLSTLGLSPTGAIPNVTTNTWTTVEVQVDISNGTAVASVWINGTLQTLASPTTPTHTSVYPATNANLMTIGSGLSVNSTDSFDGQLQQFIFQNSVPSAEIRTSISSYIIGAKP